MRALVVLLELLDQYLLGGVEPTREDLDHVFLRFGWEKEIADDLSIRKKTPQIKQSIISWFFNTVLYGKLSMVGWSQSIRLFFMTF